MKNYDITQLSSKTYYLMFLTKFKDIILLKLIILFILH